MKRLLMIAYHFPPYGGSSGIQRTVQFARYLPAFGWEPIVLTASARAYEQIGSDDAGDASNSRVYRAFARDAARQLSIRGRYPAFMGRPDRWASWWLGAVPKGLLLARRLRPEALW